MKEPIPPLDAEKSDTGQLIDNFRAPPDIEEPVSRSTLLVGARGSGKTMFLRRQRHAYKGVAILFDLRKTLLPISADTGMGGLGFSIMPSQEASIYSKAAALIAHQIAHQMNGRGITFAWKHFQRVLPSSLRTEDRPDRGENLDQIFSRVATAPLAEFSGRTAFQSTLEDFVNDLSETAGKPILLLLDRAEEVVYPALKCVVRLLDQTHRFSTIIASRPGVLGPPDLEQLDEIVPGDHFNVRHLGHRPYSATWREFQHRILGSWLPESAPGIPNEALELLFRLSRDSVRHLLELTYNSLDEEGKFSEELFNNHFCDLREALFDACQGKLRGQKSDLRRLVKKIRGHFDPFALPIRLALKGRQRYLPLMNTLSKEEWTVALMLRAGFLKSEDGVVWHPWNRPTSFELDPIFIWEEGDQWYDT